MLPLFIGVISLLVGIAIFKVKRVHSFEKVPKILKRKAIVFNLENKLWYFVSQLFFLVLSLFNFNDQYKLGLIGKQGRNSL